jgi:ATP-dependent Clp protease protease subunit
MLNNIIHYYTGQPLGRIKHDTDRDFFMSAEGAKQYGIADEVLTLLDK